MQERSKSIFNNLWGFVFEPKLSNTSAVTLNKCLSNIQNGYFKIHINEYHIVDNIVCFSKKVSIYILVATSIDKRWLTFIYGNTITDIYDIIGLRVDTSGKVSIVMSRLV